MDAIVAEQFDLSFPNDLYATNAEKIQYATGALPKTVYKKNANRRRVWLEDWFRIAAHAVVIGILMKLWRPASDTDEDRVEKED